MPWRPLKSMAPSKRNFGRPDETLEGLTKLWKSSRNFGSHSTWRPRAFCQFGSRFSDIVAAGLENSAVLQFQGAAYKYGAFFTAGRAALCGIVATTPAA
jgi:hypothetical protein